MPPSAELQRAIEQSHTVLAADPLHHLPPYLRLAIYQALAAEPGMVAGQARLAMITALHVLPLWKPRGAYVTMPVRLVGLAEGVLEGSVQARVAERAALAAWHRLDRLGREMSIGKGPYFACEAAREALKAALGRPPFGDVAITDRYAEDDLDPYCSDTAHWAMLAWEEDAEGEEAESAKRREFWHWWLTEAIPQVCRDAAH